MPEETLERRLLVAGFDALRQIGGEALVQVMLTQAGRPELTGGSDRVDIADYLAYRDAALEILQDSFCSTAFEAGRLLARSLRREHESELQVLTRQFEHANNKLPLIGQAAVLGARGNPGTVRAAMRNDAHLVLTIESCPECRGLTRDTPFCYVNQGLISELASGSLQTSVDIEESRCIAMGDEACEIVVSLQ